MSAPVWLLSPRLKGQKGVYTGNAFQQPFSKKKKLATPAWYSVPTKHTTHTNITKVWSLLNSVILQLARIAIKCIVRRQKMGRSSFILASLAIYRRWKNHNSKYLSIIIELCFKQEFIRHIWIRPKELDMDESNAIYAHCSGQQTWQDRAINSRHLTQRTFKNKLPIYEQQNKLAINLS